MYIESGTMVRLICDIEDFNGVVLASAGLEFAWNADSESQLVNGSLLLVEDDDVEIV